MMINTNYLSTAISSAAGLFGAATFQGNRLEVCLNDFENESLQGEISSKTLLRYTQCVCDLIEARAIAALDSDDICRIALGSSLCFHVLAQGHAYSRDELRALKSGTEMQIGRFIGENGGSQPVEENLNIETGLQLICDTLLERVSESGEWEAALDFCGYILKALKAEDLDDQLEMGAAVCVFEVCEGLLDGEKELLDPAKVSEIICTAAEVLGKGKLSKEGLPFPEFYVASSLGLLVECLGELEPELSDLDRAIKCVEDCAAAPKAVLLSDRGLHPNSREIVQKALKALRSY